MAKPSHIGGYSDGHTLACEQVLVTLFRKLGPWKKSVYLVGGLTPRYLVKKRPPTVPQHAGSLDVDVVIDLQMLTDIHAYKTLEQNLKDMGFERAENDQGKKLGWRWQTRPDYGTKLILELLADSPKVPGGKVKALPTGGGVSALNIPHASIVMDMFDETDITAQLLGNAGVATETIRHANLVSFVCLKAFAYDDRQERKDAHDLVYCLQHVPQSPEEVAQLFKKALAEKHEAVIHKALGVLQNRFANDPQTEGYLKDGPVAAARFELGDDTDLEFVEARALRQRGVNELIEHLLDNVK